MTGLAEFVMRGRWQALVIVLAGAISSLFCWVSAAVIALVTLRKGAAAGAWLVFWALLPAGVLVYLYGDTSPLTLLLGTFALAVVLRNSVSLSLAILASVAVGGLAGVTSLTLGAEYLAELGKLFEQFASAMMSNLPEGAEQPAMASFSQAQLAGMIGAGSAVMSALCLLLARYWQSALYNPGGFGREFRALRYPIGVTALLVLAGLGLSTVGARLGTWAMICIMPLTFAGLALVHSWGASRGRGNGWFTGFYIAWALLEPLKLLIALLAVADSWLNIRQRWGLQEPDAESPEEPPTGLNDQSDVERGSGNGGAIENDAEDREQKKHNGDPEDRKNED